LEADQLRPEEVVQLLGSLADPNAMETMRLRLSVAYNGPADGLDSGQYAHTWNQLNAPGLELQQQATTIGGQQAVIIDELPDMMSQRGAFLVANGIKYQILWQPRPEDSPQLAEEGTSAGRLFSSRHKTRARLSVRRMSVPPRQRAASSSSISWVATVCSIPPILHPTRPFRSPSSGARSWVLLRALIRCGPRSPWATTH
ncbi:MAG TPA: hypothetical protein PKE45_05810, partial [Caldilineaceae bacterium]|nr:hypothetical protein [Caldilineaceae bacterium]